MADYDVAIVGGGPAGLAAARYCLHAHLRTAIVTPELGGKINYPFAIRGIEPSHTIWGSKLVHEFETDITADGRLHHIRQQASRVSQTDSGTLSVSMVDSSSIESHTIIIVTGAAPQRLYVAGEKEYWGRGVSFSAVSHAPFFRDRDVAVVGGGERALVATLELARLAHNVYLIAAQRSMMDDLPEAVLVRQQPNVYVFNNWEIQEIAGDDFVTSLFLVGINGEIRHLAVEGVFIQFSLLPNNDIVRGLVKLDHEGRICINQHCETSIPGIFAAGDVTNIHAEQVLAAIGEGVKAALSAWEYLATHT